MVCELFRRGETSSAIYTRRFSSRTSAEKGGNAPGNDLFYRRTNDSAILISQRRDDGNARETLRRCSRYEAAGHRTVHLTRTPYANIVPSTRDTSYRCAQQSRRDIDISEKGGREKETRSFVLSHEGTLIPRASPSPSLRFVISEF